MLQFVISHDIQVHSIHYTKHFQKKSVLQSQHRYLTKTENIFNDIYFHIILHKFKFIFLFNFYYTPKL